MWFKNRFFKISTTLIAILIIIFLIGKIDFFIGPFYKFVLIVSFPLFVSGFIYYLLRPFVRMLKKIKFPSTLAILSVYVISIGLLTLFTMYTSSVIGQQIQAFIKDWPRLSLSVFGFINDLKLYETFGAFGLQFSQQITSSVQNLLPLIYNGIISAFSTIAGIAAVFLIVPFIVFFMLKDDAMFVSKLRCRTPENYRKEINEIIHETDKTLSTYIIGQAIIALIVGILMYIGFLIIGLNYAAFLALFVLITAFIPILGAIVGVIPAIFVALSSPDPYLIIKILILTLIVQQIVGNLIFPNLVGRQLNIHPLTIIIIFIGAFTLFGFLGVLIIIPVYAVIKILVSGAFKMYKIWKDNAKAVS